MAVRAIFAIFVLGLTACSAERVEPSSPTPARTPPVIGDATSPMPSPTPSASAQWEEPQAYSFTLESDCGWMSFPGRARVTVKGGAVTNVEWLDVEAVPGDRVLPTLGNILVRAEDARRSGADVLEVRMDPTDGHPVSVEIDRHENAIDDEECYEVSDFAASG